MIISGGENFHPHEIDVQLVHRGGHRTGPGDGREVVAADLDADRAAAPFLALERVAELLGEAAQLGSSVPDPPRAG